MPDGSGYHAAVGAPPHFLIIAVSHPNAGDNRRRVADCPSIMVIIGGAGLGGYRP